MQVASMLGIAAALGAIWFAIATVALTIRHRSFLVERGWDPIRTNDVPFPSILALTPTGWLQTVSFAVLGMALLALALGLWLVLDPRPTASLLALVVAGSAGLALMAPTDGSVRSVRSPLGAVHLVAFLALLVGVVLAALLLGLDLAERPAWAAVATVSLGAAGLTIILTGVSFIAPAVGSLASLLSIAVMLGWLILFGARLAVT